MDKKITLLITAGALSLSAMALLGVNQFTNKSMLTKADTTATVVYDGTHNVLDDSYVFEKAADWGKTQYATSSTGGYAISDWYITKQGGRNYSFGGESGVFTFERNSDSGWRPSVTIYATYLLSVELHFNKDVHLTARCNSGGNKAEQDDEAKADYVFDCSSSNIKEIDIFFWISDSDASGWEESVTLESMSVTYDVAACLNKA